MDIPQVSMPSLAVTSFLRWLADLVCWKDKRCQCPLGLLPHFYWIQSNPMMLRFYWCQCPLGLLPHFYKIEELDWTYIELGVNALSGCYLISTCNNSLQIHYHCIVSMPSRAVTSFLQYPFKNLGFMWLPEPVFAGIYQNILTTAAFRAC